ncbi:hypothetical protein AMECASPLE_033035 [Ameca splendens]|uniref:Uncharacterized protein n=1 Tax=Ameca splendens TaxID=208324 RepID=A0ABV0XJS8_9TELE
MFVHAAGCCYSYLEYPVGVIVVRGVSSYIQFFCSGCCLYAGFLILADNKFLTRNHNGLVIISKSTASIPLWIEQLFFLGIWLNLLVLQNSDNPGFRPGSRVIV